MKKGNQQPNNMPSAVFNNRSEEVVPLSLTLLNETTLFVDFHKRPETTYNDLLDKGVAKEQARMILPLNQYTEVYWTASFQAIMNFIELRAERTAQWEIQQYANALKKLLHTIYPETVKIWAEVHNWSE